MKVTDEMVMAGAKVLVEDAWLEPDWDKITGPCDCCGRGTSNIDDMVQNTRNTISAVIEAALIAAPKKAKK